MLIRTRYLVILVAVLTVVIIAGPKPDYPRYDLEPVYHKIQLHNLDSYVAKKEADVKDLKPDNEARIVWHGDTIHQTEYSLVYLHGFSASQEEGDPVHKDFAKRYGMNMYLARMADHGRSTDDSFKGLTPKDLINSAKEAIAIGGIIGKKIILMSCSTGSTYSVMLAADDNRIAGLIMYSPNIGLTDPAAQLVTFPWGEQLLTTVMGGNYNRINYSQAAQQYWNSVYHTDGILAVQSLIDDGMREEIFSELTLPIFVGCYYADEKHQDNVVSVEAMRDFFDQVSTPPDKKSFVEFADAGRHVFTSHIMKDSFHAVQSATYKYAENVLGLTPVD